MKMTDRQKMQVAVARDVLKWIKPSKVKASGNGYVVNRKAQSCDLLLGTDSKKVAKTLQKECQVCAKGAMFLSLVAMKNEFNFGKVIHTLGGNDYDRHISLDQTQLVSRLSNVFDKNQLDLIELCFETNEYEAKESLEIPEQDRTLEDDARIFGGRYKRDITRLRKIMENIIENKGEFRP